jgi:hypothetical protein
MRAKRGIKKNQSPKVEEIFGSANHNNYKRKGGCAAERAVNAFVISMGLTRALGPDVHRMTGLYCHRENGAR